MDVINSRTVIISPGSLCTGGGGGWHWPVTCGMSWVILTFFFFTFVLFFLLFHIFNSFFTFFYMRHINIYRYFLTLVFAFIGLLIWMILLYIFFATISIFLFDLFFSSRHLCFFFFPSTFFMSDFIFHLPRVIAIVIYPVLLLIPSLPCSLSSPNGCLILPFYLCFTFISWRTRW